MKTKKSSKKIIAIWITLIVVLLITGALLAIKKLSDNTTKSDTARLVPATEQEKIDTEQHKEEIAKQQDNKENPSSTGGPPPSSQHTVTITSATTESVYAYVAGVLEDGGKCTAIFTKDGLSFQKISQGFANVNTTQCEPIFLNKSAFPTAGNWQVIVNYDSGTAHGVSQSSTISVE